MYIWAGPFKGLVLAFVSMPHISVFFYSQERIKYTNGGRDKLAWAIVMYCNAHSFLVFFEAKVRQPNLCAAIYQAL